MKSFAVRTGDSMKRIIFILLCASLSCVAQTGTTKKGTTAKPAAPAPTEASPATSGDTVATFDTTAGKLTCTLFPKQAPKTVANFIGLATGTKDWTDPKTGQKKHGVPLFNGTIFHRVIPNFMIQGGDPLGQGTGGPGYEFEDEFSPDLTFDQPGRLAMANSGPSTNGSQFFITEVPTPHLNNRHTIFGQCTPESVEIVKEITRRPRDQRNDRPFQDVKINSIQITGPGAPAAKAAPARRRPGTRTSTGTTKKPATTTKKPQ
jgi:peptidyl-prolyl cis-trans isomerase A (cyclophilin A)